MTSEALHLSEIYADRQLVAANFHNNSLAELQLPVVQAAEAPSGVQVPYAVFGNLDAPSLVFVTSPYGCRVNDESQMVRLKAQQDALGDDACIVGLHVYEPRVLELSRRERKTVASGSFRPYADRVLSVIEAVDPRDDQNIVLYGFSMGADVSVDTAYHMTTDPQRGIRSIERLAAIEPARSQKRGSIAVVRAFSTSGNDLYNNVLASHSVALLEARGIDPTDPRAKKKHDAQVAKDVVQGNIRDVRGNLANIRGFASDESLQQLNEMIRGDTLPRTLVGRMTESPVCIRAFMDALLPSDVLTKFEVAGDHSLADNVSKSAAFVVRAVLF